MLLAKDDPAGETEALKLLDLHPNFWVAMGWLTPYYVRTGRLDKARMYAERASKRFPTAARCFISIFTRRRASLPTPHRF